MTMSERVASRARTEAATAGKSAAAKDSGVARLCQWAVDNQARWSLVLLAIIHAYDYLVADSNSPFVHLQHKIPGDAQGRYYRGSQDVYYVLYWVVAFTLIRITVMDQLLEPLARWGGVRSSRKVTRFCEQGWLVVYYTTSISAGLYVMSTQPHWLNTRHFWIDYPEGHRQLTLLMKSYYLVQIGFWFQQIFVLMIEERRKDFVVMCTHHFVTCNLLGWSMYMNYTRIGNAILCCMDFSDIFLSGTKCMRYLKLEKTSVVSFAVFIMTWIYTRHYLYMKIMWSITFESAVYLKEDMWFPERGSFHTRTVLMGFSIMLGVLQLLIIYWFTLMMRIIYRIVFLSNLEDNRSDSEDDGGDDDDSGSKRALKEKKSE
ncbi:Sphingosine N-acyltransferase lag1 [Coemansia sp. RSA 2706]|nr:Sphingosine N-acyltransferase lag1 [Coemansia sp. RSA 2706]KAJ2370400.1 Sphingosine N-acyltransferase lag1 [Coemansia sp. RSA 2610]KAJ2736856.1 Sphingosine N-acyltransferase lag1 [Coemansia sp. Cherry 401B]